MTQMITKGLLLKVQAKAGKEAALEQLLKDGLNIVYNEAKTINWYAFKINDNSFGIFDTFPDEDGRHQHHTGQLAANIMAAVQELLSEKPSIEAVDIIAFK